jgi:hypothetical protein
MVGMTIVAWERADELRGHSVARFEEQADAWLFHGSEVLVGEDTLSCTFSVVVGRDWLTRHVEVSAVAAGGETRRVLDASDGHWNVDGAARPDLDGCVDVDIAATPLTNTFPIRRLALLGVGEAVTSGVAWVDVPALGVTRVEQTYERLADADGLARWRYSDPQHGAFVLSVDALGLVVDYEGFARRLPTLASPG